MTGLARAAWLGLATVLLALFLGQGAARAETRFALVIGNDEYRGARLATPANDAGLVADALQAAGFTVTGARNLNQATLRDTLREFVDQVSAAGSDAVAFVYLSGFGLQFEGENYFVPVDADIRRDTDVPLQAIRVSDFTKALAALPGRVKIVILDAARQNPFARDGQPLAGGLALVDPVPGMAIAFNAAPGTVGTEERGPYSAYASALTEMIESGGLSLDEIFARVRLRVSDLTEGAEIPWYVSQIDGPFFMTERMADAPPAADVTPLADVRTRSMRDFGSVEAAYEAALELDTIDGYQQFLAIYPNSPFSRRIAAMLAVRREEIIWRRCVALDTPPAYWSYLRRYPNGPHVWDARRRLAFLRASFDAPPDFAFVDFGVPPPPAEELIIVREPILIFAGPAFPPPPRPPVVFLPPRPREFLTLQAPPPTRGGFALPVPVTTSLHVFVKPPATVHLTPAPGAPRGLGAKAISLPGAVQHSAVQHQATPGVSGTQSAPSGQSSPSAHGASPDSHHRAVVTTPQTSGTAPAASSGTTSPTTTRHSSPTSPQSGHPTAGTATVTPQVNSGTASTKHHAPSPPSSGQPSSGTASVNSQSSHTNQHAPTVRTQTPSQSGHPNAGTASSTPSPTPVKPSQKPTQCPPGKKLTPAGCK